MPFEVLHAPYVNVNDVELTLNRWLVQPWQKVEKGASVCELETTKATIEMESDHAGYIYFVGPAPRIVKVGEAVAYVFPSNDPSQISAIQAADSPDTRTVVSGKAKELMQQFGLTMADFPRHTAISSSTVIAVIRDRGLAAEKTTSRETPLPSFTEDQVVLYGELNLATLALDALVSGSNPAMKAAGFVPSGGSPGEFFGLPIFAEGQLAEMRGRGLRNVFPCGPAPTRRRQMSIIREAGLRAVSIAHATASVSKFAELGDGVFIGPGVIIGPTVTIGEGAVILAAATIAHHSQIGKCATVSDGAHIGGNVAIGDGTLVGIGVSVNRRVRIEENATVVSGATVVDNVPAGHVHRLDGTIVKHQEKG